MKYYFGMLIYFLLSSSGYSQNYMTVHELTLPPMGFVEFCTKGSTLCETHGSIIRVATKIETLIELDEVNRYVNQKIQPVTDMKNYGVDEVWTLPTTNSGDCEDYALLKQQILIFRGWPSSALLLTVVIDENGEYHTILTARTELGDYILDNRTKEIKLWNEFPYSFVMRQSTVNPKIWYTFGSKDE